jgi:PIN domain nuclease of toxin-antitoxin system
MNIIIDTHILLWARADPDRLNDDAKIRLYGCPLL